MLSGRRRRCRAERRRGALQTWRSSQQTAASVWELGRTEPWAGSEASPRTSPTTTTTTPVVRTVGPHGTSGAGTSSPGAALRGSWMAGRSPLSHQRSWRRSPWSPWSTWTSRSTWSTRSRTPFGRTRVPAFSPAGTIETGTSLRPEQLLLNGDFVAVVVVVFPPKQKRELRIAVLLRLGHLLKLRTIPGHKESQLVDDIFNLLIIWGPWQVHDDIRSLKKNIT